MERRSFVRLLAGLGVIPSALAGVFRKKPGVHKLMDFKIFGHPVVEVANDAELISNSTTGFYITHDDGFIEQLEAETARLLTER